MTEKLIEIRIPENKQIPDIVSFTAEENYLMLKIGSECIKEGRKAVTILTQNEIYEKLKGETQKEVEKLELDLLVQQKVNNDIEVKIKKMYENKIKEYEEKIVDLRTQILNADSYYVTKSQKDIKKEIEKYEIMYNEKDKQVEKLTNIYEKLVKQNEVKSSKKIGDEGEDEFMLLSEKTFRDFNEYKIEKKSHQGHKGDFHLFFEKFNVLVDLKNYTNSVQKKEVDKIEHDLSINNTMNFAWLISLRSNVCDWNTYPIMFKWIITDMGTKCIIIVNNFFGINNNPEESLRQLWSITNEVNRIVNVENNIDNSGIDYKERDYNLSQKIKLTQNKLTELKRNVSNITQIVKDIENELINSLKLLTNELTKNNINKTLKVQEWWDSNIEMSNDKTNKLTSTAIWLKFRKENKAYIEENKLIVDEFKEYIKNFIDADNYVEKSKNGMIEFLGFKFNDLLVEIKNEDEKIEVEINTSNIIKNKKNTKKKDGIIRTIVSLEKDNDILIQYTSCNDDIIKIAIDNEIQIWQVVSILVTNKIISKRSEARGYDKYKETEEYQLKINK